MDLADLSLSKLRQMIVDAQAEIAAREAINAARAAVDEAIQEYATARSLATLQAWRELVPEGVDVPDDPDPITAPEWVQPQAHNPYMKGDLVTYKGVVYECTRDDNAWSPLAYPQGWKEVR